jgi:Ca2+-binding RTX toxin-like protein
MLFETLETRGMLSVSVIEGYPGFFEIHGDDSANVINVSVDMDARTFAMDGQTYANVSFISVWGYGGNDVIVVSSDAPYATISAAIHGAGGDDQLSLSFDGALWGDDGNDSIYLSNAFRGEVYAGVGDDVAYLNGENIEAVVYGEGGNDVLYAANNNHGIYLYGGGGNDWLYGSAYADYLDGGNGRDTIDGGGGDDTLVGGNGDDRFFASVPNGEIYVIGGDGEDQLYNYNGTMTVWGVEELYI